MMTFPRPASVGKATVQDVCVCVCVVIIVISENGLQQEKGRWSNLNSAVCKNDGCAVWGARGHDTSVLLCFCSLSLSLSLSLAA